MWNKIQVTSHALDAMYDRLGYVRSWVWLSNLSLLIWYLNDAKKIHADGSSTYDRVLHQIKTFSSPHDSYCHDLAMIDASFRAVTFGILSIVGAVAMAYSLRYVPPHDLLSWWSCSIMTFIPASALLWYLRKGVPALFRYIPINNGVLVFMLMR